MCILAVQLPDFLEMHPGIDILITGQLGSL
jgi:hypothetical protein